MEGTTSRGTRQKIRRLAARSGSWLRLGWLSGLAALVVVAVAAGAWLLTGGELPSNREKASSSRTAEQRPPEPVRLDQLQPPPRRGSGGAERESDGTGSAEAPRVIGVGTDKFVAAQAPDAPVVSTDADSPTADIASDEEIRRNLEVMERENKRIEAALRKLGGSGIGTGKLIWPARGPINSPFGQRWGRLHAGIDIGVPSGTPVRAADAGRVVLSGPSGGYGNYMCIQHTRSLSTCYAHNSRLGARKGDRVRQGQVIARSGNTGNSTGPHLHFETRVNGKPVNPMRFL
ncbi:MAG TPA: M23 family metallopeptidase [Thermoleophilaceae bacterium]|nr:M23 family metallopeptidase [Thermoleophilaceae bacterium]